MKLTNLKRVNEIALEIKSLEADIENIKISNPRVLIQVYNLQRERASACLKHLDLQNFLLSSSINIEKESKILLLDYLEMLLAKYYAELETL